MGAGGGEGGNGCYSNDDVDEDTTHSQENPKESTCESDGEGEEGNSEWDDLHDGRGSGANTPQHTGSSFHHHSSDRHLHPHQRCWGSKCESKGVEESGRASTQEEDTVEERFSESMRSSESKNESSCEDDMDNEDSGEESSQ